MAWQICPIKPYNNYKDVYSCPQKSLFKGVLFVWGFFWWVFLFCFVFATVPFLWFPELAYTKVQLLCTFPVYHKELQDCLELLPPANREKYYINLLRQKIIKLMYLQCNDVFKFSSWILQMKRLPNVIHKVTPKVIYTQACLASKQAAQWDTPLIFNIGYRSLIYASFKRSSKTNQQYTFNLSSLNQQWFE